MNRDLALVAISLFTWGIGEGAFFYFQPIYLEELGASPIVIGTILGGVGIAMTVAHIPAGLLADRFGRRALMLSAWFLGLTAAWIMALSRTLLYGVTSYVMAPMNSYITAARGKWSVGRAITLISALYNLGAIIGPILGGLVGDTYGLRMIYFVAAVSFLISTIVIVFIRSQPVEEITPDQRNILVNRNYLGFLVVIFIAMFAMYLPQPLTPNFLQNQRNLSLGMIGSLGSIGGLGNVILSLGLGQLYARTGFFIGQLAVGISALLLWHGVGIHFYALGYFLLGGYRTARSLAIAQIREIIHQSRMGLAYGIAETVAATATIIAPPLAGVLYEFNPTSIYPTSVGLVLTSIVIGLVYNPLGTKGEENGNLSG
jgi:MFS family permease